MSRRQTDMSVRGYNVRLDLLTVSTSRPGIVGVGRPDQGSPKAGGTPSVGEGRGQEDGQPGAEARVEGERHQGETLLTAGRPAGLSQDYLRWAGTAGQPGSGEL